MFATIIVFKYFPTVKVEYDQADIEPMQFPTFLGIYLWWRS